MDPISFAEQRWRALIKVALLHAETPGKSPAALHRVIRSLKGMQTPGDTRLWAALKYVAVYFADGDLARRQTLAPLLHGLSLYCAGLLEPAPPEPEAMAAAVGGERLAWWQRD